MPTHRLTKRAVDGLIPGKTDVFVWDSELKGFGVKVTPAGRRTYVIQYRLGGRKGRTRRVAIGTHGNITTEQARIDAKRRLGLVHTGLDPAAERDLARSAPTFGEVLDQFLVEHADAKLKPRTAEEYRRLARLHVDQPLRTKLFQDIDRADVSHLHFKMHARPQAANRVIALISKLCNWGEGRGLRPENSNPCRHIEKYPENKRERFLSGDELLDLDAALRQAEEMNLATPHAIAAIRLLLLTGARLNEILTLKWRYIDFETNQIRLPDSKTGRKSIYLSPQAIELLQSIKRQEGNPYVICGLVPGSHIVNLQKPWRRIRKLAGLDDVRLHDLRHSFASIAVANGVSLPIVGALLGHSQPATTQRYAHFAAEPLKEANDMIGSLVSAAMTNGR